MSGVRLAAWIPGMRAVPSTSPLLTALEITIADVSGFMYTRPRATARRWVGSLGVTSTMRARPSGWRWVKPLWSAMWKSLSRPSSAADLAHAAGGTDEVDLADGVPGPLLSHVGSHGRGQVVIAPVAPQDRSQIGLAHGEQAVPEL